MTDGITYKQAIDLGFKRQDQHDSVFFDDNGYDWFLVTMKLAKRVELDWDCQTHDVTMYRYDRDANVKGMIPLENIESVKEMIDFYKKTK